jgi:DNA repair protein REV1
MGRKGRCITIKVMQRHKDAGQAAKHLGHGICDSTSKSTALDKATDAPDIIDRHCYSMLKSFHIPYVDIRGLGIQVTKLDYEETVPGKKAL